MELLVNEFIEYVIKFIVLGAIAVAGAICGAKYKKIKLAKDASASKTDSDDIVQ